MSTAFQLEELSRMHDDERHADADRSRLARMAIAARGCCAATLSIADRIVRAIRPTRATAESC